jgi:hypothetical protein
MKPTPNVASAPRQADPHENLSLSTQPTGLGAVALQSFTATDKKLAKLSKVNPYASLSAQELINLHLRKTHRLRSSSRFGLVVDKRFFFAWHERLSLLAVQLKRMPA